MHMFFRNYLGVGLLEQVSEIERIRNFYMLVKLVLISDTYCILMICYTPIATFQKAGTCLDDKHSMAKQPIKDCVSNHSCTCGKSVSEKSE